MPQVNQTNEPTATTIRENKPFRDRLRDRYAPTQFVRVINIDNEEFTWQYFPIDGEEESFTDNGAVRVISGRQRFIPGFESKIPGKEQVWALGAGETEVLVGANADLFIEGLYKRLVAKKRLNTVSNDPKRPEINFNFSDGLAQEQMIDKILLGVVNPNFDEPKEPARVGRPPKAE